jgi:hypothetical protein
MTHHLFFDNRTTLDSDTTTMKWFATGAKIMNTTPQRKLSLQAFDGSFAVCRLAHDSTIPAWATSNSFFSITRTRDELSIVCAESQVPSDIRCERDWRCLRVVGSIEFTEIGVLASLVSPLAAAGISVFAISTFDTDYLFVKTADWQSTVMRLNEVGHKIIFVG